MTTPTELCNLALAHLGQARISDYSERSPAAEHCRRAFDHTRRLCLRDYDWNFAIRRTTLTAADAAPAFDWGYSYPLPEDCLRVLGVNQRPGGTRLTDYAIEGRAILSNAATCQVRYVADATDVSDWDAVFCSYFAYRLAAAIAPSLRLDPQAGQQMEQMAAAIREQAREADAVESQPRVTRLDQSEIIEEREGRRAPWFSSGTPGGTAPGGTATWGSIGGTLTDQADLVAALAGKAAVSHTHSADQITAGTFSAARFAGTATEGWALRIVSGIPEWALAGDVVGPASATNDALTRFDGTTGKLIQSSTATLTDAGLLTVPDASVTGTLTAPHIHGNLAGSIYSHVRNESGGPLTKGTPVYIVGYSVGQSRALIAAAASGNSASMPAIGILDADLANNENGHCVVFGVIENLNTLSYQVNAPLYVASGGGLTATEPSARIQPIAQVERVNANNGSILVLTALYGSLAQQSEGAVSITGGTITGLTNLTSTIGTFSASLTVSSATAGAFSTSADATINGVRIGRGNTNLSSNLVLGAGTGSALNASSFGDTLIGTSVGNAITSSQGTTAIGERIFTTATTGVGSATAVGSQCQRFATAAASSVSVGALTFSNSITTTQSTAVGAEAGRFIADGVTFNTSATNSVFIGYKSSPLASGQSNQIVIGQGATGDGSDTTVIGNTSTTQSRIYGADLIQTGTNGQSGVLGQVTVLLSAFTGSTRTATALIPANCIVIGVSARVTTAITGATSFDIGDGTTANLFADDLAVALGTTSNLVITPRVYATATNVVCTANGSNFTAGAVRLTVHYMRIIAPTS